MSLDGFVLNAQSLELEARFKGAKLEKVHQPLPYALSLQFSCGGKRHRLLASADPQLPRLIVTAEQFENPLVPPFFCLILRKHIEGSRLERVSMPGFERAVFLDFASRDELGNPAVFRLCVELTGRHSNVILLNEQGVIIDAIKRISLSTSAARPILPGLRYELPPTQNRVSPITLSFQDISCQAPEKQVHTALSETVQGLSQLLAKEIAHRQGVSGMRMADVTPDKAQALATEVQLLAKQACEEPKLHGYVYFGEKVLFHIFPLTHVGQEPVVVEGVNATISLALSRATAFQAIEGLRQRLKKTAAVSLEKTNRKLEALQEDLAEARLRDDYKRYGELLYANLGTAKIQDGRAEVTDFFSENMDKITIPVDIKLGITDNAKAYFKRYNRAVNTERHSLERLAEGKVQIEYLSSLLTSIEQAEDTQTLREIEEEMRSQGFSLRSSASSHKKRSETPQGPRTYTAPDGSVISVGRNNIQNEQLVKNAHPEETWMHVQKAPGSHVIIHAHAPSQETLSYAANLAAYFSSQRLSSQVPIDFTKKRNVKRPGGAKPGYVIYENHQTLYVSKPLPPN